ncbi:hypothetical protein D3C78_1210170 [compost metagenome]
MQLVARAGAQHQTPEQVQVAGVFSGFEHLGLQGLQLLVQAQHPLTFVGQARTAAALASDNPLHQRFLRQIVQLIDRIPGGLVAHARAFGRAGDRALFGDVLQQGDALRTADDVLGQQGGQRHGKSLWVVTMVRTLAAWVA